MKLEIIRQSPTPTITESLGLFYANQIRIQRQHVRRLRKAILKQRLKLLWLKITSL